MENMEMYKGIVATIVRREGGLREKEIWKKLHTMEQGETWNKAHKVVNILTAEPDEDGYFPGFAVDIVTWSICG